MRERNQEIHVLLLPEEMERIKSLDLDTTAFYSHENPNDVERLNNIRYDI